MVLRALVTIALAALLGADALRAQSGSPRAEKCVDPTPNEPAWSQVKWQPQPNGSSIGTEPKPPQLAGDLQLDKWAGKYRLTLVSTAGTIQRDTVSAVITLWAPMSPLELKPPLVGGTDSAFRIPYGPALAHPTWQRDPARPGIVVLYDRRPGRITLVFGNGDLRTTDSGVFFDVFAIGNDSLGGRWVDGGLAVLVDSSGHAGPHPQGYFCLQRLS